MGVTRVIKNGRVLYRARLTWDGKRISAGYYNTEIEAEEACKRRLKQLYKARDEKIAAAAKQHQVIENIAMMEFSDDVKARLLQTEGDPQLFKAADVHHATHRAVKPSLFKRIKQIFHQ